MPRKAHITPHLSLSELRSRYRGSRDVVLRTHYHMLLLLSEGHTITQIAPLLGYSTRWIGTILARYNENGPEALGDGRHRNPGREPVLDDKLSEELTEALKGVAPDGGLWTGPKIVRWVEARVGRKFPDQRGSEWARRLGFSLQRPRRRHVKADEQVQEDFKETD